MGNGLVVLQPLASRGSRGFFFRADLLILNRRVDQGSGHRIEYGLKQPPHGAKLLGPQAVEVGVSLLTFLKEVRSHVFTVSSGAGRWKPGLAPSSPRA